MLPTSLGSLPAFRLPFAPQHSSYTFPFGEGTDAGSPASLSAVGHLGSPSLLVSTYF